MSFFKNLGKTIKNGVNSITGNIFPTAINAGQSMLGGFVNEFFADRARQKNFEINEKAAQAADRRQRKMYEDLSSPQAMLRQYAAAGLSPSMMMSGGQSAIGSNAAGNMASGASGGYPSAGVGNPLLELQMQQLKANIENIKADTENKQQHTDNLTTENDLTIAKIAETYKNIANMEVYNEIMHIDKDMKKSLLSVQQANEPWQVETAMHQASVLYYQSVKLQGESEQINLQNKFTLETWKTNVDQLTADLQKTIAETALINANIELTQEQIKSLIEHIAIDWYNANTNRENAKTALKSLDAQMEQWCMQNGISNKQLDVERTKMWLSFVSSNLGSILHVAAMMK